MKLDIKELIAERLNHKVSDSSLVSDGLLKKRLDAGADEFAIILPNGLMEDIQKSVKYPDLKKYYVTGIYELGYIDFLKNPNGSLFTLFTFSRNKPKNFKICFVPKFVLDFEKINFSKKGEIAVFMYYKDLEAYINTSKVSNSIRSLVNDVPYSEFCENNFNICYYTREYLPVKKSLKKQEIVKLKDLVEFIPAKRGSRDCLKKNDIILSDLEGFVILEFLDETAIDREKLSFYPIILRVKSNRVTAEYLYLYMQSKVFKILSLPVAYNRSWTQINVLGELPVPLPNTKKPMAENKELSQKYEEFCRLSPKSFFIGDLNYIEDGSSKDSVANIKKQSPRKKTEPTPKRRSNIVASKACSLKCEPVKRTKSIPSEKALQPRKEQIENRVEKPKWVKNAIRVEKPIRADKRIKESLETPAEMDYESFFAGMDYSAFLRPGKDVVQNDALFDELQERLVDEPHKRKILEFIDDSMKELKINIPNGAYRSAIVLVGSILETVLIDWASEKDGKDYFEKPYRTVNIDGRPQDIYMSLNDAICRIGKVVKEWDARDKADAIREMRNSIHPKVFLRQNKKLTKAECNSALKDLGAVIKSRYGDYSMS